jgi:hypothetical protein
VPAEHLRLARSRDTGTAGAMIRFCMVCHHESRPSEAGDDMVGASGPRAKRFARSRVRRCALAVVAAAAIGFAPSAGIAAPENEPETATWRSLMGTDDSEEPSRPGDTGRGQAPSPSGAGDSAGSGGAAMQWESWVGQKVVVSRSDSATIGQLIALDPMVAVLTTDTGETLVIPRDAIVGISVLSQPLQEPTTRSPTHGRRMFRTGIGLTAAGATVTLVGFILTGLYAPPDCYEIDGYGSCYNAPEIYLPVLLPGLAMLGPGIPMLVIGKPLQEPTNRSPTYGRGMFRTGIGLTAAGAPLTLVGFIMAGLYGDSCWSYGGYGECSDRIYVPILVSGLAMLGPGIPMLVIGKRRWRGGRAADVSRMRIAPLVSRTRAGAGLTLRF